MAPCTHPGMKRPFCPKGKRWPRSLRSLRLASLLVERYMRQGCLVLAIGRLRSKKRKKKTKSLQTLKKHTTKYIHSSPATATTSKRRAAEDVPLGSPYSHSSSVNLGFVEIGLACIHTYVYTRTAAAAAPPVYVLVLYTIFWPAQLRLSLL